MARHLVGVPGRRGATVTSMARAANAVLHARPTLLFLLVALVIPNAIFLAADLAGVGTPPRPGAIVAYLAVVVIARAFSRGVALAAYLFVLAYDLVNTVSLLFGLSFVEITAALRYAEQLRLFKSPLYLMIGFGVLTTSALMGWFLMTARDRLREARLGPALLGTVALVVLDLAVNTSPHYHFGTAFAAGQPFESAVKLSGFESVTQSARRPNLLLVIVEGLGKFADPQQQALLTAPFRNKALHKRYDVVTGESSYFGSTTAAEMRELCATRTSYTTLLKEAQSGTPACLPDRLARRGYHTLGVHGFSGHMFDRARWWPKIGIQETMFRSKLVPPLPVCGAVFLGACDPAIVARIQKRLRERDEPQFVYWLTLNTHIPVKPGEHSDRFHCGDEGGPFGQPRVCDMAAMWGDVFQRIAQMAVDPQLPPTEILIVGDHAPPLWSRRDRALFKPGVVSWIRLAWKGGAVATTR